MTAARVTTPTRPLLRGTFGMAASTHWLASATAMSVLERGGNAFDAAAAAGFVLQVVEPHLCGPAGEVPILLWSERDQRVRVVCGQGVAPAAASIETFEGLGLDLIPGTGLLSATVPGAFGGWLAMLAQWGTWRLRDVLGYAIGYARDGYPAIASLVSTIGAVAPMFKQHWPTSAAAWLPGGETPTLGMRLTNPGLAATYERVIALAEGRAHDRDGQLRAARDVWYGGFVAEEIARFSAGTRWIDTSGAAHGGLLDYDDLAGWRPTVEDPATYDYGRYTVCKTAEWGQGPVFLQQLALLSGMDLDAKPFGSASWLHTVVEAGKLAFADREAWYGDSPAVPDLLGTVLGEPYNAQRRALIADTASLDLRPGAVDGNHPRLAGLPVAAGAPRAAGSGEPTVTLNGRTNGDTCHVDVVDRDGNMVSATPSGGWLQSSPYIPQLGFCLGTRAQMFFLDRGLPNSLRPGARPRTTLSPSLALRDGRPWLAFGTPGGDQQDQWSLVFFLNLVHGGLDLQEAIDAPMLTSLHFPSSFYPREARPGRLLVEDRLPPDIIAELTDRGHDVVLAGAWSLGRLSAVAREDAFLTAAANPRNAQGYAVGR